MLPVQPKYCFYRTINGRRAVVAARDTNRANLAYKLLIYQYKAVKTHQISLFATTATKNLCSWWQILVAKNIFIINNLREQIQSATVPPKKNQAQDGETQKTGPFSMLFSK